MPTFGSVKSKKLTGGNSFMLVFEQLFLIVIKALQIKTHISIVRHYPR